MIETRDDSAGGLDATGIAQIIDGVLLGEVWADFAANEVRLDLTGYQGKNSDAQIQGVPETGQDL